MTSTIVIDDVTPRQQCTATASQTVFNTNFTADALTDIKVYQRGSGDSASDADDILVYGTDYTVSFVGGSETVRVTLTTGATVGDIVTIVRDTPSERDNLYINTNFTPTMLNGDFGRRTFIEQQNEMYHTTIGPRYNVSASISNPKDTILPITAAGQTWRKNSGDTAFETYDLPDGGAAPKDAKYLVQTADSDLPNAQAMGALSSGLVVNTVTTGVQLTRTLTGTANEIGITNGTGIGGDPTVGIVDNPQMPGSAGMGIPSGTTAQRVTPVAPNINMRWNTDLNAVEFYDHGSSQWEQFSEILPDGPDTSVQYNNGGAFAGSANFTYDGTQLAVTGNIQAGNLNISANVISATNTDGSVTLNPNGLGGAVIGSIGVTDRYLTINSGGATFGRMDALSASGEFRLTASNTAANTNVMTFRTAIAGTAAERMRLHNNGFLGIGITAPTSTLHVVGDAQVDNININGNAITSTDTNGDITITADGTGIVNVTDNFVAGDPGSEGSGINVNGTTYDSVFKASDIGSSNIAQSILHRHSTTLQPLMIAARSNSDTNSHAAVTNGMALFSLYGAGWTSGHYDLFGGIHIDADSTGTISATSSPGRMRFQVTADASNTPTTALTINNDKSATFANNVTLSAGTLSVTGDAQIDNININGNTITATDTNGNVILKPDGTGYVQVDRSGSATNAYLRVQSSGNTYGYMETNAGSAEAIIGTGHLGTSSTKLLFQTAASGTPTTRATITGSGHFGIGGAPTYRLDVTGSGSAYMARFSDLKSAGSALVSIRNTAAVNTSNQSGFEFRLNSSTSERQSGVITTNFTTTTDATRASRMDFKTISSAAQVTPLSLVQNECHVNGVSWDGGTNVLDSYLSKYEYTPTVTCGSGSITLNSSINTLGYTRIGSLVHVQGQLSVSSVSSPSGTLTLSLPITAASMGKNSEYMTGSCVIANAASNANEYCIQIASASSTTVSILRSSTTALGNPAADFSGDEIIRVGFSYLV